MVHALWMAIAPASVGAATVVAVGCRAMISRARFGPETTEMRSGSAPVVSTITSLMRINVPSSMPFMRLTNNASGAIHCAH